MQHADVIAAMRQLSARDQEVLELHLWEGLESREIAEVLGLTRPSSVPGSPAPGPGSATSLGNDPGRPDISPQHHTLASYRKER